MAIISLEGMRLWGKHGYYPEEETLGREFILNVQVYVNIKEAAEEDELSHSVNYETLYHICQSEFRQPAKLLETVAQRILERINRQFEGLKGVKVKIRKMNPPLGGPVDEASVEVCDGLFDLPPLKVFKALLDIAEDIEDLLE
ncbi:MAG: dihydroneopterin aldolase [Saprospiraceae bacterium]|nr:dihydroneopterin aldolase [Lewinella sp.]